MSKVIEANINDFSEKVLAADKPVLVDFWASWCGPCIMMAPVLDDLAEDLAESLKVVKVQIDTPENQSLAEDYQVMSIPNLKVFRAGEVIGEFVGLRPKNILKQELESLL